MHLTQRAKHQTLFPPLSSGSRQTRRITYAIKKLVSILIKSANAAQAGTPNQLPVKGQIGSIARNKMKMPTPTQGQRIGSTKLVLFFMGMG